MLGKKIELQTTKSVKDKEREYRVNLYFYRKDSIYEHRGLLDKPMMKEYNLPPMLKVFVTWEKYKNEILRQFPNVAYIEILSVRTVQEIIDAIEKQAPQSKAKKDFFQRPNQSEKIDIIDISHTIFKIKKSPIDGDGLFAKDKIKQNTILFTIDGDMIDMKDKEESYPAGEWNSIADGLFLTRKERTIYGYINHSRTPNAFIDVQDFTVKAKREIVENEEITLDYREEPLPQEYVEGFGKTYL